MTLQQWKILLREDLQSPSLEIFKTRLDKALVQNYLNIQAGFVLSKRLDKRCPDVPLHLNYYVSQ